MDKPEMFTERNLTSVLFECLGRVAYCQQQYAKDGDDADIYNSAEKVKEAISMELNFLTQVESF